MKWDVQIAGHRHLLTPEESPCRLVAEIATVTSNQQEWQSKPIGESPEGAGDLASKF